MREVPECVGFFEKNYLVPVRLFNSLKNLVNTNILEADESLKKIIEKKFMLLTYEDVEELSDYFQQNYAVFRKHVKDMLPESREEFEKRELGGCGKIWQTAKENIIDSLIENTISNSSIWNGIKELKIDQTEKRRILHYIVSSRHKDKICSIAEKTKEPQLFMCLLCFIDDLKQLDNVFDRVVDNTKFIKLFDDSYEYLIKETAKIINTYDASTVANIIANQEKKDDMFKVVFSDENDILDQLHSIKINR